MITLSRQSGRKARVEKGMKYRKVSLSVGAAVLIGAGVTLGAPFAASAKVAQDPATTLKTGTAGVPVRFASAVPSASVTSGKILNETAGDTLIPTNLYNTATSGNWSGYITAGSSGAYDEADAKFKVPSVSCAKDPNSAVSFWPGIDGAVDPTTVEQLGISVVCEGTTANYFAWLEEYPNPAQEIANAEKVPAPVKPGDIVTASVSDAAPPSGTKYDFAIEDLSQNWEYTGSQDMPSGYSGEDSTSEVIVEAPTSGNTGYQFPLADFTTPAIFDSSNYNTSTAFSSGDSTAYNIADDGEQLDSTGSISSTGAFDVTYQKSDEATAPTGLKASSDNISIGWKAVSGATKYEVKIDGPNLDKDGTVAADQTHVIYYDIAGGTYKYQVRAINAAGDSPWTALKSVVFNNGSNSTETNSTATENSTAVVSDGSQSSTVPTTPTGLTASADNIALGWTAVSNAERYEVYIDGPNLNKTGSVASDQTHVIYYDIAKGTFKYEVRTFNVTGYGPWTALGTVSFTR
jgi:Peptidase A4 family